jgi:ankyrin repeat protein
VQAQENSKDIFELQGQSSTLAPKTIIIINKKQNHNVTNGMNNNDVLNNSDLLASNQNQDDEILIDKTQDIPLNQLYQWMFTIQKSPRNYQKIQQLLQNGQNVNAIIFTNGYYGNSTILHVAAWQNDEKLFELGINYGGSIHLRTNNGDNVLHFAAKAKNSKILELALMKNHDLKIMNQKDKKGMTPLMFDAIGGNLENAKLLIENQANLNIQANDGKTALDYAMMTGHWNLAKFYIESGANINLLDNENHNFNDYLLNYGTIEGFKLLQQYASQRVQNIISQKYLDNH